jgi:hypothetical protein
MSERFKQGSAAPEHESFDDARLLNLIKKRREADVLRDVLRCVRRCQRGEYVFAPHDRFLWQARELI